MQEKFLKIFTGNEKHRNHGLDETGL